MTDVKTGEDEFFLGRAIRLLVLVPHRDARLRLLKWCGLLWEAGLPGAWSFPRVAPLAVLGRRPSGDLPAPLARTLGERARPSDGKFRLGPPALAGLPLETESGPLFAFGPSLETALPENFPSEWDGIPVRRISPTVIGAALLRGPVPAGLPPAPEFAFRAAALAVMRLRIPPGAGDFSAEWEIGGLRWLAKGAG